MSWTPAATSLGPQGSAGPPMPLPLGQLPGAWLDHPPQHQQGIQNAQLANQRQVRPSHLCPQNRYHTSCSHCAGKAPRPAWDGRACSPVQTHLAPGPLWAGAPRWAQPPGWDRASHSPSQQKVQMGRGKGCHESQECPRVTLETRSPRKVGLAGDTASSATGP